MAGLGHQWQAVANCGSGTCSKALPFIEIPKVHHWPRFAPLKLRSIVKRGRFKAAATPGTDLEGRAVLAKQALQLSVDWKPKFGLASEITHLTDAWLDRSVQSLLRFEPRVVKSAYCWEARCAWCDLKRLSIVVSILWHVKTLSLVDQVPQLCQGLLGHRLNGLLIV